MQSMWYHEINVQVTFYIFKCILTFIIHSFSILWFKLNCRAYGETPTKYYYKPLSCVISWNSKEEMNGKMMFLFLVCELYKRLILLMTKNFIIRCATIDVSCLTKECAYFFIFSTTNNDKILIVLSYARPFK